MTLKDIIDRLLSRADKNPRESALDRLKVVVMQDRSALPGTVMEQIRKDIIAVLAKHCDIDENSLDVSVERADGGGVALIANIPIRNIRQDQGKPAMKKEAPKSTPGS